MKIINISDLHCEFRNSRLDYAIPECDVLIMAGDTDVGPVGLLNTAWALKQVKKSRRPEVIYVLGNHEGYGRADFESMYRRFPELTREYHDLWGVNIHVLQNSTTTIQGVDFLGGTLWTDFALTGEQSEAMQQAPYRMNDYRHCKSQPGQLITPAWILSEHQKTVDYLSDQLIDPDHDRPQVVVTHHLPTEKSIHANYHHAGRTNSYYASRLDPLIENSPNLRYWFCGHTHNSSQVQIGGCEVIVNPRGYPHDENPEYDPGLMVEIDAT